MQKQIQKSAKLKCLSVAGIDQSANLSLAFGLNCLDQIDFQFNRETISFAIIITITINFASRAIKLVNQETGNNIDFNRKDNKIFCSLLVWIFTTHTPPEKNEVKSNYCKQTHYVLRFYKLFVDDTISVCLSYKLHIFHMSMDLQRKLKLILSLITESENCSQRVIVQFAKVF